MKYTVYLRTNLVNGKQYVGQTKNFKRRENNWRDYYTKYGNKQITSDREKYGLENFKVEILAEVETREEAWDLEQKFTLEYNTKYPNGYNMSNGGKSPTGTIRTEEDKMNMSKAQIGKTIPDEIRKKISEGHKGKKPWNTGKHLSEEHRKKISEGNKGKITSDETRKKLSEANKGHKMPESVKKKLLETHIGKPAYNRRECVQLSLTDEFITFHPSLSVEGFDCGKISDCCKGKRKSHRGFHWMYKEDYDKMKNGEVIAPTIII